MSAKVISADSHVQISHEAIKAHLASKYHEAYDEAVTEYDRRTFRDSPTGQVNAGHMDVQKTLAQTHTHPAAGRAGHSDAVERLQDMDTDRVDVEVLYCEVSAFRYLYDLKSGAREATRAFNDTLQDFAATDPKRLVLSYQIPIHDIHDAVAEVKRVIGIGAHSLQLPVFPAQLGYPDYYHERYEPLFSVIEESGLPICCHIGLNAALDDVARRDPTPNKAIMVSMSGLSSSEAFGMWIMTGVLAKFPRLKVVMVEAGLGWVASWVEKADDMVTRRGYKFPELEELPSTYFHRQMFLTFIDEPLAIECLRYRLGVENIMWSSDYPHPVSSWPNSEAIISKQFRDVPVDEKELIISGNAERVWNL